MKNVMTITYDTDEPISLEDFNKSLSALKKEYDSITLNSSALLVKEIRKGSFEIDLLAVAYVTVPLLTTINNTNSIIQFLDYFKATSNWLIGRSKKPDEIKYSIDEIGKFKEIFQPISQSPDEKAILRISSSDSNDKIAYTKDDAIKISKNFTAELEINNEEEETIEMDLSRKKVLFYWYQACFDDTKLNTGNKGTISQIDKHPKKVIFLDDDSITKKEMTKNHSELSVDWQKVGYIVDVEIMVSDGKVKAYKILKNYMHDAIDD